MCLDDSSHHALGNLSPFTALITRSHFHFSLRNFTCVILLSQVKAYVMETISSLKASRAFLKTRQCLFSSTTSKTPQIFVITRRALKFLASKTLLTNTCNHLDLKGTRTSFHRNTSQSKGLFRRTNLSLRLKCPYRQTLLVILIFNLFLSLH